MGNLLVQCISLDKEIALQNALRLLVKQCKIKMISFILQWTLK